MFFRRSHRNQSKRVAKSQWFNRHGVSAQSVDKAVFSNSAYRYASQWLKVDNLKG